MSSSRTSHYHSNSIKWSTIVDIILASVLVICIMRCVYKKLYPRKTETE